MKRPDTDVEQPSSPGQRRGIWKSLKTTAVWSLGPGLCALIASAIGFAFASAGLGPPISRMDERELKTIVMLWCAVGTVSGLLVGAAVGFILGRGHRASRIVALSLAGTLTGAAGGCLTPWVVFVSDPAVPVIVSSSAAWGTVGLLVGGLAYPVSRLVKESPEFEDEDELVQPCLTATTWQPARRPSARHRWPLLRVLPVVAATGYALLAACLTAPSTVALVLLAIGLLGVANVYVVVDHERRLRNLESIPRH